MAQTTNEELVAQIQRTKSDNARSRLLGKLYERNLPLIRQWLAPYGGYAEMDDLLQEGFFGLVKAAKKYNPDAGASFITYARYWVVQAAQRSIEETAYLIRVPSYLRQKITRYRKSIGELSQQLCRNPSTQELADYLCTDREEIEKLRSLSQSVVSLDAPYREDEADGFTLSDLLPDKSADTEKEVISEIFEKSKKDVWCIVAETVSDKENIVVVGRYRRGLTFRQIGEELGGISPQAAREIEAKAWRKLRSVKVRRELSAKFELIDSRLFDTGLARFRRRWASSPEEIAIKHISLQGK